MDWKKLHSSQKARDSSLTYDEMEDISFRVSKLEDMIKGIDSKYGLKGMVNKEDCWVL